MNVTADRRAKLETLAPGQARSCELVVSAQDVDTFARLSGDDNPLHVDAETARAYGFPKCVAHGMLSLGAISRLIGTELPGPGALWLSQDVQFVSAVLVGSRLVATVTVKQVSKATGVVLLDTLVMNKDTNEPVLTGSAKVKILAEPASNAESPKGPSERVAIVTGSSRGLGRAIAEGLAADGIKVVVHCRERVGEAGDVVATITAAGGQAVACQVDLTRPDGPDVLFDRTCEAFGKVDIVVNSATPPIVAKSALDCRWDEFSPYLELYVGTAFRLTQLAAPGMQSRRFGRIVNVLSSYALGVPPPRLAPYVTAKSALAGLSRSLAVELGPWGITVNMLAPSIVVTEQTAAAGDRARQLAAAQTPLRRLADVQDVADAARFLVSDAARFLTGVVIPVTGGQVMLS